MPKPHVSVFSLLLLLLLLLFVVIQICQFIHVPKLLPLFKNILVMKPILPKTLNVFIWCLAVKPTLSGCLFDFGNATYISLRYFTFFSGFWQ